MPSHRGPRIAEAIREVVSSAILFDVSDPRVKGVTVLRAEVAPDLRSATVFVSFMGSEGEQKLAMKGIQHASGFLQAKVAARLQTRFTPTLTFQRDDGVKKSIEISRLIDEAIASDRRDRPAGPESRRKTRNSTSPNETRPGWHAARPKDRLRTHRDPHMAAPSKAQLLNEVHTLLKKRYKLDAHGDRPTVFEAIVYGIVHEGSTREQANQVISRFKDDFFDWNEVRVSSIEEIQGVLSGLPDPEARASKSRRFLRQLFERAIAIPGLKSYEFAR